MGFSTNFFLNSIDLVFINLCLCIFTLLLNLLNSQIRKKYTPENFDESIMRKIYIFFFQTIFKYLEGNLNFILIYFYL
jgi:hypothetical protein